MESFYGGRQGAPFSIVKRFDCIKTQENDYKWKYFAYWSGKDCYLIIDNKLVSKEEYINIPTPAEFGDLNEYATAYEAGQIYWKKIKLKSGEVISIIDSSLSEGRTYTISSSEEEKLEGMLDCFEQGAATLNEINYEEYCIIDCLSYHEEDIQNYDAFCKAEHGQIYKRNIDNTATYFGQINGFNGISQGFKILREMVTIPDDSKTPEQYAKDWSLDGANNENTYKFGSILYNDGQNNKTIYIYDYYEEKWIPMAFISNATTTSNGLMSAVDKIRLNTLQERMYYDNGGGDDSNHPGSYMGTDNNDRPIYRKVFQGTTETWSVGTTNLISPHYIDNIQYVISIKGIVHRVSSGQPGEPPSHSIDITNLLKVGYVVELQSNIDAAYINDHTYYTIEIIYAQSPQNN